MTIETKYFDPVQYAQSIDDVAKKYMNEDGETTNMIAVYPKIIGGGPSTRIPKKKNHALRKKLMKKEVVSEASKAISVNEIILALGGEDFYKKSFKTYAAARTYTLNNLKKIMSVFSIQQKDLPIASLEIKLKSLVGSK